MRGCAENVALLAVLVVALAPVVVTVNKVSTVIPNRARRRRMLTPVVGYG
jgi:hypothetical protein